MFIQPSLTHEKQGLSCTHRAFLNSVRVGLIDPDTAFEQLLNTRSLEG